MKILKVLLILIAVACIGVALSYPIRYKIELDSNNNELEELSNMRRKVMEAAYDYVKHNRLLCQHYEERMDWYKELLARRDELDKSLWKRVEAWEARKR